MNEWKFIKRKNNYRTHVDIMWNSTKTPKVLEFKSDISIQKSFEHEITTPNTKWKSFYRSQHFSNKQYILLQKQFYMPSNVCISYNRDIFNLDVVFGIIFN